MNPGLVMFIYGMCAAFIGFVVGTMYPGVFAEEIKDEQEDEGEE